MCKMTFTWRKWQTHVYGIYFGFAEQAQVGAYSLSDLVVQLQILALRLLLLLSWYSCSKTHLCTCKCRCERAEPGVGTKPLYWSMPDQYIQIFLSLQCKHSAHKMSQCNKKPTENMGYILTELEEKNATEVAQLMQQMLLYCKVLF